MSIFHIDISREDERPILTKYNFLIHSVLDDKISVRKVRGKSINPEHFHRQLRNARGQLPPSFAGHRLRRQRGYITDDTELYGTIDGLIACAMNYSKIEFSFFFTCQMWINNTFVFDVCYLDY